MTDGMHMGQDPDEAAYLERREVDRLEDASSNRVPKYGMLGHLLCPETSAPCDGTKPGCCGANAIPNRPEPFVERCMSCGRPWDATRNRGAEAHGIIHQAIKESTNRARRDGRDATYYEKAKAVVLALREAGFDV